MSRLSPLAAGALALVIASSLVALAGITSANATPSASPGAGQVIVQGVLYDADGSRAGAGERVTLTAWPTSEVLAGLADGEPVPTLTAGVAITDAAGAFALRYSDPAALASYADADGTLDFSLESEAGGVPHSFNLSRTLPGADARVAAQVPADAALAAAVALRPVPGASPATSERSVRDGEASLAAACAYVKLSDLGPRWVQVGEAYTVSGVTAAFTYSSGASSTLGIGVSASGASGTFSLSGSNSVSSTLAISMPPISGLGGRLWKTQFVYSKFGYACPPTPGYQSYQVRATSFAGGSTYSSALSSPSASYCTPQNAGSIVNVTTSNAYTFSGGAGLSGSIGINLSSKTGFTSTAKLKFTFSSAGKLCGTTGYPGGTPSRLVAKH